MNHGMEQLGFKTTSWSVLALLRNGDERARTSAMDTLAAAYWPSVYSHLRAVGYEQERAADLTQGYFADVVLARRLFQRAQLERGRLRTLILASLKYYLATLHRTQARRSAAKTTVRIDGFDDEERIYATLAADQPSPDAVFERRWAISILDEAIRLCRKHYDTSQRQSHWRIFEARFLHPAVNGTSPPLLAELSAQEGFATAADAAAAVHRVKKRFQTILLDLLRTADFDVREAERHELFSPALQQ